MPVRTVTGAIMDMGMGMDMGTTTIMGTEAMDMAATITRRHPMTGRLRLAPP